MPPKNKKQQQVAKKVEDKTFGMKNKNKSKKVQQFVQTVQKSQAMAGQSLKDFRDAEARKVARTAEKKAAEEMAKETAALFKTVAPVAGAKQVVPEGADPKSILCSFFKAGSCIRGKKCKFSHDLDLVRKSAKMNIYEDPRKQDTMDTWDQNKLEEVVKSKETKRPNETQIICKYFLEALEQRKYGWFWQCPNGNDTCIYKHALPPGYVLKTEKKQRDADEDDDEITLEEQIEIERKALDLSKCTPVTPDTFAQWKFDRKKAREEAVEQKRKDAEKSKGGRGLHVMSGRDLFTFDPSLFVDDDDAADDDAYEVKELSEEEQKEQALMDQKIADGEVGNSLATAIEEDLFLDDEPLPEDDE